MPEFDENGIKKGWWHDVKGGFSKVWHHRAVMKRTEFATLSAAFAHKNKHALIILADPETDVIFVSYDDQIAVNRITDVEGHQMNVVKKALNGKEESIVNLIGYVASAIKDNHTAILSRNQKGPRLIIDKKGRKFDNYDQLRKANELEKLEKKKERTEMRKIQQEQEKTDIETGQKEVSGIDKLKDLFRRKITKGR